MKCFGPWSEGSQHPPLVVVCLLSKKISRRSKHVDTTALCMCTKTVYRSLKRWNARSALYVGTTGVYTECCTPGTECCTEAQQVIWRATNSTRYQCCTTNDAVYFMYWDLPSQKIFLHVLKWRTNLPKDSMKCIHSNATTQKLFPESFPGKSYQHYLRTTQTSTSMS